MGPNLVALTVHLCYATAPYALAWDCVPSVVEC